MKDSTAGGLEWTLPHFTKLSNEQKLGTGYSKGQNKKPLWSKNEKERKTYHTGHYRNILKDEVKTLGWVVQDVWMPTRLVVVK